MKFHMIDSQVPLREHADLWTLCGKLVRNATFVLYFDSELTEQRVRVRGACQSCYITPTKHRYCYGIIPGEEAKQLEAVSD